MSEMERVRVWLKRDKDDPTMIKMLTGTGKNRILQAVLFEDFFPDNLRRMLREGKSEVSAGLIFEED